MTDDNRDSAEKAFAQYLESVQPQHDCDHNAECPHDAGLYFMVMRDPADPTDNNAYLSRYHLHKMDASRTIQAVIDFVDTVFQNNRGDAPAMVAHTRGRDLLRHAVETVPPPVSVSQELVSFMDEHLDAWKGLTGE